MAAICRSPASRRASELSRRECIAALDRALFEPGLEPAHALLRGAVGEGVGDDLAPAAFLRSLQCVVADRRRGSQRRLHVAGVEELQALLRAVRPYPGEAVGLQLHLDLEMVRLRLPHAALQLLRLGQDAEQVLHMMTELVGDYVGLGELARLIVCAGAEPAREQVEERCVEIDLLVGRAIEWTHCGERLSAAVRTGSAPEQ